MKKKVIATLAAAVMAAGLMACGSTKEAATEATSVAAEAASEAASEVAAEAETVVEEAATEAETAAEEAATEAATEVEELANEATAEGSVVDGFMLDAANMSFTVLTTNGEVVTYTADNMSDLIDGGVEVAHNYEITLDGDEVTAIVCTDNVMMNKDYDGLYTAAQVILAFRNEDLSYLSGLCAYPLTVDGDMVYEKAEDLAAAQWGDVITDALAQSVLTSNLYYADFEGDDFSISTEGTAPEVVISKTGDTKWQVSAINN